MEIPQLRKIKDSYKLLNGKYPSPIHLLNKVMMKRILLKKIPAFPILKEISFLGIDKLIQYDNIAKKRQKQAIIGN